MIEIRLATPADAEAIASLSADIQALHAASLPRLFKPAGRDTFPAAVVRDLLAEPQRVVVVACAGEDVIGYASAEVQRYGETPFRYAMERLYIQWMGVQGAWRGRGVGKRLVGALADIARTRGCQSLALDVWSFNADALAFYERAGFRPSRHILTLELTDAN